MGRAWLPTALLLLLCATPGKLQATALCEEAKAAWADAQKLPRAEAKYWRYVSLYRYQDDKKLLELHEKLVLLFHLNCLSHEPGFVTEKSGGLVRVGPTLWRINTQEYGEEFTRAWEALARTNPYFPCLERIKVVQTVPAKVVKTIVPVEEVAVPRVWVWREGRGFVGAAITEVRDGEKVYRQIGGNSYEEIPRPALPKPRPAVAPLVPVEEVDPKDIKVAAYLPSEEMAGLVKLLDTRAPLVRADWLYYRSAISVNRQGDGYYDFHGFKSRDDAYKLAGLDLKEVSRLKADMAAMINESGVATNNIRQVWWVKTYAGSWFQTFDVNQDAVGKRNLLRLTGTSLDKVDFDHDAEESYFTLSNGLWGVIANDNKGVLQKFVPTEIASDRNSTSNDLRIHNCKSCFGCHEEGLRPLEDWGREIYRQSEKAHKNGQVLLGSPDPKKLYRLKQLYLSDMPEQVDTDNARYAVKLKKLCGMTPKEVSAGVYKVYKLYADDRLGMKEIAAELGTKPETWDKALRGYAEARYARSELIDPLLAGLIAEKPSRIGRPQLEELYPVLQVILGEKKP